MDIENGKNSEFIIPKLVLQIWAYKRVLSLVLFISFFFCSTSTKPIVIDTNSLPPMLHKIVVVNKSGHEPVYLTVQDSVHYKRDQIGQSVFQDTLLNNNVSDTFEMYSKACYHVIGYGRYMAPPVGFGGDSLYASFTFDAPYILNNDDSSVVNVSITAENELKPWINH